MILRDLRLNSMQILGSQYQATMLCRVDIAQSLQSVCYFPATPSMRFHSTLSGTPTQNCLLYVRRIALYMASRSDFTTPVLIPNIF